MARALRFDVLRLDAFTRTPQGGIRVPAALARTGVQIYRDASGRETREYRPPEEVFHKDAIESFHYAPLTIGHVPSVNPDNWGACAVGHVVGAPRQDGKFLSAETAIMRADAIRKIESGELKELSCGYEVEIDNTPGITADGERYDSVQRSIRGNHVALLPVGAGRAGPDVRLRADSAEDAKEYPGGVAWRSDSIESYPAIMADQPKAETKTEAAKEVVTEVKKDESAAVLLGRIDSLTAANADLQRKLDAMPGQVEAMATARASLIGAVAPLMPKSDKGEGWRADGKSEKVIMLEALSVLRPSAKFDGKEDGFVRGAFEAALEGAQVSRERAGAAQRPIGLIRADSGGGDDADMDDMEKKNRDSRKRSADAWKQPIKGAMTKDSLRKGV